ncbi:MAG: fatty acid desaturase [Alteromonadaceae bacterium]|nr:MAG: fatty acid desaturase [Alteromonadaceae bacterium]
MSNAQPVNDRITPKQWKPLVAPFTKTHLGKEIWQLTNSLGAYVLLWVTMYFTLAVSWWLTAAVAILAGAFLVRVFIIFHDCGHGSYFRSKTARSIWGFVCGMATFTAYGQWTWEHAHHHANSGNLDERGIGDIWTMTVEEYRHASLWERLGYRAVRNPIILFVIGPLLHFTFQHRIPNSSGNSKLKRSVWFMNFALAAKVIVLMSIFGVLPYLFIQVICMAVGASIGTWLFYVQHQHDDAYWEKKEDWDFTDAALKGSSFYKLPRVMQWFSGNIGFHHVHHLSSRIPNYNLEACHNALSIFNQVKPITLLPSLKTMSYRLWCEADKTLVGWSYLKQSIRAQSSQN